jgi:hypothetical protein
LAVVVSRGENTYDTKRHPLSFGTIAAVLRAKLSPMPVLGMRNNAKFGPIAAVRPARAICRYSEKTVTLKRSMMVCLPFEAAV